MKDLYHIVVVEDDEILLKVLKNSLSKHEFNVSTFTHGQAAYDFVQQSATCPFGRVQILVSDVQLPDITGLVLVQKLRDNEPLGKILISINSQDQDKISGLLVGADDYIGKPVNPDELLLRIRALIRRLDLDEETGPIKFLDCTLDPERKILCCGIKETLLGDAEMQLLLTLIGQQGQIVNREKLVSLLGNDYREGRSLDMLVSRLRKKMSHIEPQAERIVTYRGKGYMLAKQLEPVTDPV